VQELQRARIDQIVQTLRREVGRFRTPIVTQIREDTRDPFKVLISCLLSLRTKDEVTSGASMRLFELGETPEAILRLSEEAIAEAIYPVGFYRTKAKRILEICQTLVAEYGGRVPDNLDELLRLKGVGRKTANLVVTLGYGKPGICVDTHVHRICNRLGLVQTKTPEQTEMALRQVLPPEYWIEINDLLVTWGQNVCSPISPLCSECALESLCPKIGEGRRR
jgi:endonuclease-3